MILFERGPHAVYRALPNRSRLVITCRAGGERNLTRFPLELSRIRVTLISISEKGPR